MMRTTASWCWTGRVSPAWGAFSGAVTANTDGVALTGRSFGPFSRGAFYAVHDDGNVAAFDLAEIVRALGLDCPPPR